MFSMETYGGENVQKTVFHKNVIESVLDLSIFYVVWVISFFSHVMHIIGENHDQAAY